MGAMQQNALAQHVRLSCIPEEITRLEGILNAWRGASAKMASLANAESGLPDRIVIQDPPLALRERTEEIASDRLFKASFSAMPTTFKVVELDHLVAAQRDVNLDYVDALRARIPGNSTAELLDYCVGSRTAPPDLKTLQTATNQMTFSSRSLDLRFLGGSPKPLTESDIAVAHLGGQPVEAVALLVGFGTPSISAWQIGSRLVLGNGFHRVFALRMEGIKSIPIVVQHVANVEIEFPDQFLGLSRAYLVHQPRPVLVKDFFDSTLTVELKLKPRRKVLKVMWGEESSVVPD